MDNLEKYSNVFKNIFSVEDSQLGENFKFKDITTWDSFTHLTLISELESVFDIILKSDDILHFGGYENGKKILSKYGVKFEDK